MKNIRNFILAIAFIFTATFSGCEDDAEDLDPPQVRENTEQSDCTDAGDSEVVEEDAGEELPDDDNEDSDVDSAGGSIEENEDVPDEDVPDEGEEPTEDTDDSESSEGEDPVPGWLFLFFLSYLIF